MLRFEEAYLERIWGGEKLRTLYGKPIPPNTPIGEAWLIADHPQHESVVAEGPHQGRTLRSLLEDNPREILGGQPRLTIHGRFPLLLKILDANDLLSVQVHPDDACAAQLGEHDVGKSEMWHVLQADPHSEIICGLKPDVTPERLVDALRVSGAVSLEPASCSRQPSASDPVVHLMDRFEVAEGTSVFVPAGTVHAIGAGVVLAEIQQNSNLTYRLYDWQRVDVSGKPRPLHVERALKAIHFGSRVSGPPATHVQPPASPPTTNLSASSLSSFSLPLARCPHFVAECVQVHETWERTVMDETFHIVLVKAGPLTFAIDEDEMSLCAGQAVLVPGSLSRFLVRGTGSLLDYYVAV